MVLVLSPNKLPKDVLLIVSLLQVTSDAFQPCSFVSVEINCWLSPHPWRCLKNV